MRLTSLDRRSGNRILMAYCKLVQPQRPAEAARRSCTPKLHDEAARRFPLTGCIDDHD
jgi:hypothetical protein